MSGHGRREAAWQLNAILWHDRVYADVHSEQESSGAIGAFSSFEIRRRRASRPTK